MQMQEEVGRSPKASAGCSPPPVARALSAHPRLGLEGRREVNAADVALARLEHADLPHRTSRGGRPRSRATIGPLIGVLLSPNGSGSS
jgi:hypothetical protein